MTVGQSVSAKRDNEVNAGFLARKGRGTVHRAILRMVETLITLMAIKKNSIQQSETQQATNNPLAEIAGRFGGKFWLETQSEIENYRRIDREETIKYLDTESKQQD